MQGSIRPLSEEVYLEDPLNFLHPVLRGLLVYIKTLVLCMGILILAILLPIPISLINAFLQLIRLKPLQALKSVLGGIFVSVFFVIVACMGVVPFLLQKTFSYIFASYKKQLNPHSYEVDKETGMDMASFVSQREEKNNILCTAYTPVIYSRRCRFSSVKAYNNSRVVVSFSTMDEFYPYSTIKGKALKNPAYSNCTVVFCHYLGALKGDKLNSSNDLINAGIQIVYDVIKNNGWGNDQIENYLKLEGRSLGGGIAYNVALHFKKYHGIDIHVDGQNTFTSISQVCANILKFYFNIPMWCGNIFSKLLLPAGGGFEIDTLAAALQLNPNYVHFSNLKYIKNHPENTKTFFEKIDYSLWGTPHYEPDTVVGNETSLYKGMKQASKQNQTPSSTYYSFFQTLHLEQNKPIHRVEIPRPSPATKLKLLQAGVANHEFFASYLRNKQVPDDVYVEKTIDSRFFNYLVSLGF